jgi:hypothetical protein
VESRKEDSRCPPRPFFFELPDSNIKASHFCSAQAETGNLWGTLQMFPRYRFAQIESAYAMEYGEVRIKLAALFRRKWIL